jgi:hypothetical protein
MATPSVWPSSVPFLPSVRSAMPYDGALAEAMNGAYKSDSLAVPAGGRGGPSRTSSWPPCRGSTGTTPSAYENLGYRTPEEVKTAYAARNPDREPVRCRIGGASIKPRAFTPDPKDGSAPSSESGGAAELGWTP